MFFPPTSLFLGALPADERVTFIAKLTSTDLPVNMVLFESEAKPKYVYFPTSGIASVVTPLADGQMVEVGLIGREGFPGSFHLLGDQTGPTRCFMQVAGAGLRMEFKQFVQECLSSPRLYRLVLQHAQCETLVLSQLSACNRLHEVDGRLARWLLMVQDRVGGKTLMLTHEFLSEMLATRRSTVSIAAAVLQREGLIEYQRGKVQIMDREGLEGVACECYAIVRKLYKNLYN